MDEHEPEHGMFRGKSEETLDAHTAQLVESIVGAFYKPLVEMIDELEDRVQVLERQVRELQHGNEKTEQGG